METRFKSFEEFWPYYVGEHKKKSTRVMHFVGTTAAMACLAGGLLTKRRWLLAVAPFAGYGPAWISHFFIEKNRPATFTYPLWSLKADFVMWGKMAMGKMDAEVARVAAEAQAKADADAAADTSAKAAASPAPAPVRVDAKPETVN
jgi:hypothetical protein